MHETVWFERFPALRAIDDAAGQRILRAAQIVRVPAQTTVFESGAVCRNYLLIIDGTVRVQQLAVSGREIVLYRVGPGESCVLTTTCLLAHSRYVAEGISETDVVAAAIPAAAFQDAMETSEGLRRFIFAAYGERLAALLRLLEEIAFERLDARLAKRLLALGSDSPHIAITHQALAVELGSAREVIGRMLKHFAEQGWVTTHRGEIEILNRGALCKLAAEE
ncbi:Crp/Fnr family transcriptional regulator [Acidihalobacter ferrooxydans]|nr:Crp/Fnr family transcriptional regulator [Acidihalobacter ferrooxydans]